MFTTHFELGKLAILRQDGQFTVVRNPQSYLRVDGKPEELQYVHPTYKMREALAIERATNLRRQHPKTTFTIKPYGNAKNPTGYVIWAQSPDKKSFAELKPYRFFAHESRRRKISYGRLLEWLIGMPFAQATYENGTQIGETEYKGGVLTFNGRPATVDEILKEAHIYSLDIEARGWKDIEIGELDVPDAVLDQYLHQLELDSTGTRREKLDVLRNHCNSTRKDETASIVGASDVAKSHLIGPFGNGTTTRTTPWGSLELELVNAESVTDIINAENAGMPPSTLFIVGSNLKYDLEKLGATGIYKPGVDGSEPKKASREIGFYRRMEIAGREIVDIAALSQHVIPQSANNKLSTALGHSLEIPVEKPSGYDDLIRDQIQLAMGWEPARQRLLDYSAWDGHGPLVFLQNYLKSLLLASQMFGLSVTDLCTIAKDAAGNYAEDKAHFLRYNTVHTQPNDREFGLQELALRYLRRTKDEGVQTGFSESHTVTSGQKVTRNQAGVYRDVHLVHLMPYVKACEPIIRNRPEASEVLARIREVDNPTEKLMLALFLEAFISNAVQELDTYNLSGFFHSNKIPAPNVREEFEDRYGVSMERLNQRAKLALFGGVYPYKTSQGEIVQQDITGLDRTLAGLQMPNHSKYFVLLGHPYSQNELEKRISQMVAEGLAIDMGKGHFVSAGKGRFAGYVNGLLAKQGMDVDAGRGYKSFWEKEVLPELIRFGAMGKVGEAKEFLEESCALAWYLPIDRFEFVTTAGRDAEDYSIRAHVQRRVKLIGEMNARRGQEVRESIKSQDDFKMRFGSRGENGTLFDGVIGKVARAVIPGLTHAEFERIINGKQGTLVAA